VLAKYVQAYARANGIAEGRVRAWISYMITAGVLQRAAAGGQPPFIVKGGVALELRLRNRARATKDIDLALRLPDADLALTLDSSSQYTSSCFSGIEQIGKSLRYLNS
jgi:hypothetical protein